MPELIALPCFNKHVYSFTLCGYFPFIFYVHHDGVIPIISHGTTFTIIRGKKYWILGLYTALSTHIIKSPLFLLRRQFLPFGGGAPG